MTDVITITHSNEGVRINWGDGTSHTYANAVQLAEAYARSHGRRHVAAVLLTDEAAEHIAAVESLVDSDSGGTVEEINGLLRAVRATLCDAVKLLS